MDVRNRLRKTNKSLKGHFQSSSFETVMVWSPSFRMSCLWAGVRIWQYRALECAEKVAEQVMDFTCRQQSEDRGPSRYDAVQWKGVLIDQRTSSSYLELWKRWLFAYPRGIMKLGSCSCSHSEIVCWYSRFCQSRSGHPEIRLNIWAGEKTYTYPTSTQGHHMVMAAFNYSQKGQTGRSICDTWIWKALTKPME